MSVFAQKDEEVKALTATEERAVSLYRYLAHKILGKPIKVTLVRRPPQNGVVTDAVFERRKSHLRINLLGTWDLHDPLGATALALLFHELAHFYTAAHDAAFAEAVGQVAGRGAALLAKEGNRLAELYGIAQ